MESRRSMDPCPDHAVDILGRLLSKQQALDSVPDSLWPVLVSTAIKQNAGPLLLYEIKQQGYAERLTPHLDPLVYHARAAGVRYTHLHTAQQKASAALAEANIPSVWMKGIALAQTLYPQPVLRPMSDLDVLVPPERALEAVDVLKASDFQPETFSPLGDQIRARVPVEQDLHHYGMHGGPGGSIRLEVHFSFARQLLPTAADLAWFWTQTMPAMTRTGTPLHFLTLTHEAHLLYLCAHIVLQHGQERMRLSHYYDLCLLSSLKNLDWALIVEQAVKLRWTYTVEQALTQTREYFGTPVPNYELSELRERRPANEDVSIVQKLSQGDTRWTQTLRTFKQLTPSQRWFMLRKITVPPRAHMRKRYGIPPNRAVWPYYPYRWFDQFKGMLRGIYRSLQIRFQQRSR